MPRHVRPAALPRRRRMATDFATVAMATIAFVTAVGCATPAPSEPGTPTRVSAEPRWVTRGSGTEPEADSPEACRACGGAWARHGRGGGESCLCATPDAGKACHGPRECASACVILDRDAASRAEALRCGPDGCTDRDGTAQPAPVGTCSATYRWFGCTTLIEERPGTDQPTYRAVGLCVD